MNDPVEQNQETPAQRLRAVLFLLWKQQVAHTDILFNDYYHAAMEKIINQQKLGLED